MQRSQCGRGRKPQRVSDEQMRQAGKDTNTKQPEPGDPLGHDRRKQRAQRRVVGKMSPKQDRQAHGGRQCGSV